MVAGSLSKRRKSEQKRTRQDLFLGTASRPSTLMREISFARSETNYCRLASNPSLWLMLSAEVLVRTLGGVPRVPPEKTSDEPHATRTLLLSLAEQTSCILKNLTNETLLSFGGSRVEPMLPTRTLGSGHSPRGTWASASSPMHPTASISHCRCSTLLPFSSLSTTARGRIWIPWRAAVL
jgi:hypothetical protein